MIFVLFGCFSFFVRNKHFKIFSDFIYSIDENDIREIYCMQMFQKHSTFQRIKFGAVDKSRDIYGDIQFIWLRSWRGLILPDLILNGIHLILNRVV